MVYLSPEGSWLPLKRPACVKKLFRRSKQDYVSAQVGLPLYPHTYQSHLGLL